MDIRCLRPYAPPPVPARAFPIAQQFEQSLGVRALKIANACFGGIYHQVTVLEPSQLPLVGPGILICNHVNFLDPILIQAHVTRTITWMMAREYYDMPVLGRIFQTVEAIPVDRDGRDVSATRAAMRALDEGRILGLFPEGGLQEPGARALKPFQPGVGMLALRSAAPVYPAYIDGTHRGKSFAQACLLRQHAVLAFGEALSPVKSAGRRPGIEAVTAQFQGSVEGLKKQVDHFRFSGWG